MCSSCMHIDSSTNNDFSWQPICISVPWVRCSYQMKKKHMGRSDGRMVHYTWMSSHLKLHIGICMTSLTVFGRNPIDSINGLDSSYGIMAMDAQLNLGLVGTFTLQSKWVWWEHGYTWQAALKGMLCGSFLKPRTSITPPPHLWAFLRSSHAPQPHMAHMMVTAIRRRGWEGSNFNAPHSLLFGLQSTTCKLNGPWLVQIQDGSAHCDVKLP